MIPAEQQPKKTTLEIHVLSRNTINEYAQKILDHEKNHFNQFIGKDIFKVDGSIKQKYQHERIEFKGQFEDGVWYNVHYWFEYQYNAFTVRIKSCINGGSYDVKPVTAFTKYDETSLVLFNTNKDHQLIETVTDTSHIDQRFDVAELTKLGNEASEAAKEYDKVATKVPYLFREVLGVQRLTR